MNTDNQTTMTKQLPTPISETEAIILVRLGKIEKAKKMFKMLGEKRPHMKEYYQSYIEAITQ